MRGAIIRGAFVIPALSRKVCRIGRLFRIECHVEPQQDSLVHHGNFARQRVWHAGVTEASKAARLPGGTTPNLETGYIKLTVRWIYCAVQGRETEIARDADYGPLQPFGAGV